MAMANITSAPDKGKHSRRKHGLTHLPEYNIWKAMRARCHRKTHSEYYRYGGRGILVCSEWRDSAAAFYADMGPRPSNKHTIERIDNNLGYFKENCKWATYGEQVRNTRRNILLTMDGVTRCMCDWADTYGIRRNVLGRRIHAGMSIKEALAMPVRPRRKLT